MKYFLIFLVGVVFCKNMTLNGHDYKYEKCDFSDTKNVTFIVQSHLGVNIYIIDKRHLNQLKTPKHIDSVCYQLNQTNTIHSCILANNYRTDSGMTFNDYHFAILNPNSESVDVEYSIIYTDVPINPALFIVVVIFLCISLIMTCVLIFVKVRKYCQTRTDYEMQ